MGIIIFGKIKRLLTSVLADSNIRQFIAIEAEAEKFKTKQLLLKFKKCGKNVGLRRQVIVYSPENLSVGDDVSIGEFSVLRASGGMTIGNRVLIAANCILTTRSHPINLPRRGITEDGPIYIGDDVWLGSGSIILPGVSVGNGSIVAAGAVVTKNVAANTIVAGIPAKVIKNIENQAI